jgi:hypothetical protein
VIGILFVNVLPVSFVGVSKHTAGLGSLLHGRQLDSPVRMGLEWAGCRERRPGGR